MPLLIGCPVEDITAFTLNLLTDDDVIEVDQDRLGQMAQTVVSDGDRQVLVKEMEDGSLVVGLFNRVAASSPVEDKWSELGLQGSQAVRDLWRQKDLGVMSGRFSASASSHGAILVPVRATQADVRERWVRPNSRNELGRNPHRFCDKKKNERRATAGLFAVF